MRFAETENYSIEIDGDVALTRVWKRPDLDSATGARLAGEMAADIGRLVADGRIKKLVFDVTAAPPVAGPKTTETLAKLLTTCERANVDIEVVVTNDAVQTLQFKRLIAEHAPKRGKLRVGSQ